MKKFLLFSTLFASLFFVVNCSNKSNNTAGTANAYTNSACPAGYYYYNGQCLNGQGGTIGAGYNYSLGFYADNYSGYSNLQITNITNMKQLLKYGMGVCDLASNNYGLANCDAYIQGWFDVIIQLPSDFNVANGGTASALVTFAVRPQQNQYYNFQASFGSWWQVAGSFFGINIPDTNYYSGAYRNPLQIQAQASPINNSQGFSINGYGDAWTGYNRTIVTVEVASGNQSSNYADFVLKVGGQEAARGRMAKCQTPNCGL
ncbi:MAG: hypothetical protein K0R29_849 [Pseudobdellovibrio sp.]|jgi:hypothetical protein|nr:hypothetical protein [Pseudobdellovibrio sp.]